MKKLLMLLLALILTGCSAAPISEAVTALPEEVSLPRPGAPESQSAQETVTLWFRYLDEPLLAPETRALSFSPDQPMELTLISALLSGPDTQSADLTALFPAGTRVLSTVRQGRTLFVTLSRQIMDGYPDEPADWQSDAYWAAEMPLRRRLCMQSLIATVTENCDVDSVQVLLEQTGEATDSLRLRQRYYLNANDAQQLADPLLRDDSLLLSPSTAMTTVLTLWQQQDWSRLSRYVSGGADGLSTLPRLLDFTLTGPTISGPNATFTLTATLRGGAGDTTLTGRVLRLTREGERWLISEEQLTGWLEGTP